METPRPLTLRDVLTHIVGDIAKAVSARPGEAPHQRVRRIQAASHTVMSFQPTDAVEAMFAGHCVIFHEMLVDTIHRSMSGQDGAVGRSSKSIIVALDKAFGNNVVRLERYRASRADGSADLRPAPSLGEVDIAERVQRHQSTSPTNAAAAMAPVDACEATAEAAAVDAADPVASEDALGGDLSGENDPAGGERMSSLNGSIQGNMGPPRGAACAGNRQARRHAARNGTLNRTSAATGI